MIPLPFNPFSALTSKIFGGIAIAALTFGAVQTVRIEGLWFIDGFKDDLAERDRTIAEMKASSEANRALAIAQVKAAEARSAQIAKEADHDHEQALADARSRTAAYANANRVPAINVCRSTTASPAEGEHPGIPADVPADSRMVAIRETDLQALSDWVAYGVAAHNNAVDKLEAGTAIVVKPVTAADAPDPAFGH